MTPANQMNTPATTRRILPYYLIQFLSNLSLGIIIPVFVLYFRHRGLNLFQIAALAVIFEGSIALLELPTGLVADLYGRKLSVVLSLFTIGAAGVIFGVSTVFWGLALAETIHGLGETLKSGALEAWVVDSLKEEGRDGETGAVFARGVRLERMGYLLGLVLGGYIGAQRITAIWYPFALGHLACGAVAVSMMRERSSAARQGKAKTYLGITIREGLGALRAQRFLLVLFAFSFLANFGHETVDQYWQVHLAEDLAVDPRYFGWLVGLSTGAVILLVTVVTRLLGRLGTQRYGLIVLEGTAALCVAGLALTVSPLAAMGLFVALGAFRGFKKPIFLDLINRHIPSEARATLLSLESLLGSLGEGLAGLIIGGVAFYLGIRVCFGLGAVVLGLGVAVLLWSGRKGGNN
jgi:DHA3 family tetracycline resistance protein-like MFS transporter